MRNIHRSDDLWRKIYRQVNPKDYNDYKLRTTWEHMTHRALTKKAPPTDVLSLVLHFGSFNLQCGFAGDELPCAITPNLVKKYEGHYYAGSDVSHIDGGLMIRPFIKREVVSFPALEMMWEHSVSQLQHRLKDDLGTLILMSDMRKDPREKVTQVAFETWDTPMFYMASPQVTCVYATGMTSAIIVDVGYEITSIGVVYEGTLIHISALSS
jgi:actin-related protein